LPRRLTIHANTVRHRLKRFEELTGRPLTNSEVAVELWLALEADLSSTTIRAPERNPRTRVLSLTQTWISTSKRPSRFLSRLRQDPPANTFGIPDAGTVHVWPPHAGLGQRRRPNPGAGARGQ
jgi:PucR C-terminal helix-turn-helix domain